MKKESMARGFSDLVISGIGITSAIGQGKDAFASALLEGNASFKVMERPGRQSKQGSVSTSFLGAEISALSFPDKLLQEVLRTASFSAQVALITLDQAWRDARLDLVDPTRIGLIIGGSNIQQRDLVLTYERYRDRLAYLRPTYGFSFMDSDLVGICTQHFGIKGPSFTVGGASASSQVAIIQGCNALESRFIDVCIVLGALMDISYWECQAFSSLGAMGSNRFAEHPQLASRPFDNLSDGFIFGESCGAIVIESCKHLGRPGVLPLAGLSGWAMTVDANRNPNPSAEGEIAAIKRALMHAGVSPEQVNYINPHGTGSPQGDLTELSALKSCGLSHAKINATKSITGHGLTAAGIVEIIATLIQMESSRLHPTRNLDDAIDTSFNWVASSGEDHHIKEALNLSYGFGGLNTAVCLRRL
jgi:malonyl-ACP decarboxylase